VAIFRLQIQSLGRDTARRATAAAAYRSGEPIRDERSGEVFNYSRRQDVVHKEMFVPSRVDGPSMDWARDRQKLWNAAEHAETRSHARVAREFQIALPPELTAEQRLALARTFSREVADRYNIAVDLAIHDPKRGSDPRNFHAHLLATTREVTPNGLGARAGLDMSRGERERLQLPSVKEEYRSLRERWATLTNEALREAKVDARVDHRAAAPTRTSALRVQEMAREAWRQFREPTGPTTGASHESTPSLRAADNDHSL
jgi:ATP-dependent exoDNAse (exonuclease V) alpha subunit